MLCLLADTKSARSGQEESQTCCRRRARMEHQRCSEGPERCLEDGRRSFSEVQDEPVHSPTHWHIINIRELETAQKYKRKWLTCCPWTKALTPLPRVRRGCPWCSLEGRSHPTQQGSWANDTNTPPKFPGHTEPGSLLFV